MPRRETAAPGPDPLHSATYAELVGIVAAWQYDLEGARAAWDEVQARRAALRRVGWTPDATARYGPAGDGPAVPPWWGAEQPRPRAVRWQRPESSTCYLSDEDLQREAIDREARAYWRRTTAAGVPRER